MSRSLVGCAALLVATPVMAQDAVPPEGLPPRVVQAQMTLGDAGLLRAYYESDQFGTVQWRIGQARVTIGAAASASAAGRPASNYSDRTTDGVVPVNALYGLPGGNSLIRIGVRGTYSNGGNRPVELDGGIVRADVQYVVFPTVDTMLAVGVLAESTDLDIIDSGTVKRKGAGVRVDGLDKFSSHWGIAARAEYSWGENDLSVAAGPTAVMRHKQGDDHLYVQAELVGHYRNAEVGLVPKGWVAYPVLGVQYQHNALEATANSFGQISSGVVGDTENYGTVWANLRLERDVSPHVWSPRFVVGIEQEYVNDLDVVVKEPTYAVVGAGIARVFGRSKRVEFAYTRHQGLTGDRINDALVAAFSWNL